MSYLFLQIQPRHSIAFGSHYLTCLDPLVPDPGVTCLRLLASSLLARHSFPHSCRLRHHSQSSSPRPWPQRIWTIHLSTSWRQEMCRKLRAMHSCIVQTLRPPLGAASPNPYVRFKGAFTAFVDAALVVPIFQADIVGHPPPLSYADSSA